MRVRSHRAARRLPADDLHHLKVLREAGLVGSEPRGTWVYYWVLPEALARLSVLLQTPRPPRSPSPRPFPRRTPHERAGAADAAGGRRGAGERRAGRGGGRLRNPGRRTVPRHRGAAAGQLPRHVLRPRGAHRTARSGLRGALQPGRDLRRLVHRPPHPRGRRPHPPRGSGVRTGRAHQAPLLVASYIGAAYWFTKGVEAVRPIRDEIGRRVRGLLAELGIDPAA